MRNLSILLISFLFLASCVPNKDLVYLQGEPIKNKEIRKINDTPYKLQVNDIITIDIKSTDPDLVKWFTKSQTSVNNNNIALNGGAYFTGSTIDRHGNIRLPYLREINVLGYTTVEVRKKIEAELASRFQSENDYFVTVKLDGIRYTVMGEVGSPGPNVIYQNEVSILDAVTNSGDITLTGDRKMWK